MTVMRSFDVTTTRPHLLARAIATLALAAAALAVSVAVDGNVSSAHERDRTDPNGPVPVVVDGHQHQDHRGLGQDGCAEYPEAGRHARVFEHACDHHEWCIAGPAQQTRRMHGHRHKLDVREPLSTIAFVSDTTCRKEFRADLTASCSVYADHGPSHRRCRRAADAVVRVAERGGSPIDGADITWAAAGHADRDGLEDLYLFAPDGTASPTGSLYVARATGTSFEQPELVRGPGVGRPDWAAVGDFDGDGIDDIAWRQHRVLFVFDGDRGLSTVGHIAVTPEAWAGVGDFDGGPGEQIAWFVTDGADAATGTIYRSRHDDRGAVVGFDLARGPGIGRPTVADVGDLDRDGIDDIAWQQGNHLFVFDGSGGRFWDMWDVELDPWSPRDGWFLAELDQRFRGNQATMFIVPRQRADCMSISWTQSLVFRPREHSGCRPVGPNGLTIVGTFAGASTGDRVVLIH